MTIDESSEVTANNTTNITLSIHHLSFLPWLKDEINTVKKITERNKQSIDNNYDKLLKQIQEKVTFSIQQIQDNRNINRNHEKSLKYDYTEAEILNGIANSDKVTATICDYEKKVSDIENRIILLKTVQSSYYSDCKSRIWAHKKAIQYFETFFDINIISVKINENEIIIQMAINGFKQYPIMLVFHRDIQIKSFQISCSNNNEKYRELKEWFEGAHMNPTNLIIKLRKYITNLT
ncbi:hypothetical protein Trydic_g22428 [Trypoxylus dichotomus]